MSIDVGLAVVAGLSYRRASGHDHNEVLRGGDVRVGDAVRLTRMSQ
jgi:hypothetical protein